MKANFALSLSFDGITLLERVQKGWCERGSVSLDTDTLSKDMSQLLEHVTSQEHDATNVKLVLPQEQIKYLVLPLISDQTDDEIENFIKQELEGATPYSVSDLRLDWCLKDAHVYVAAVALETMEEAESFAITHGFTPLGNVAIAPKGAFDGEVHFGSFRGLSPLERDTHQIVIVPAPIDIGTPDETKQQPLPVVSVPVVSISNETQINATVSSETSPNKATDPMAPIDTEIDDTATPPETIEPSSTSGIGAFFVSKRDADTETLASLSDVAPPLASPTPVAPSHMISAEKSRLTVSTVRELGGALFESLRKIPVPLIAALLFLATLAGAYQLIRPSADAQTEISLLSEPAFVDTTLPERTNVLDIPIAARPTPESGIEFGVNPGTDSGALGTVLPGKPPEETQQPTIDVGTVDPQSLIKVPQFEDSENIAEIEATTETGANEIPIEELRRRYAVTGIWPVSPLEPQVVDPVALGDLYIASIDPEVLQQDAIALPTAQSFSTETVLNSQGVPAPNGAVFKFTDDGLVEATAQGARSPDGHMVYLGKPPVVPPSAPRQDRAETQEQPTQVAVASTGVPLQQLRPKQRPDIAIEQQVEQDERDALALLRPQIRPSGIVPSDPQEVADTETPAGIGQEIAKSVIPKARPKNLNTKVAKTNPSVAAVTPTQPRTPSKASVTANATDDNAINLRKVNLIGVFGKGNSRRALVRLSSGRRQMVEVGDRFDGGKVAAISESELRYVKSGKNIVLKMPKG